MSVQQVKIKKFTVLKDFIHDFKGQSVLITGKNAIGKSSIMKFIRIALGEKDCIAPGLEIDGEVHTNIKGEQYKFSVKMERGKPKVTVTGPNGMSDSRVGVIGKITGAMNFDITEFVRMSMSDKGRKDQVALFKSFFPEEIVEGINNMEANVKVAFEERAQLNKDVKQLAAAIKSNELDVMVDTELAKIKEVDISATMADLKKIQEANAKVQGVINNRDVRAKELVSERQAIGELEERLAKMMSAYDAKEKLQGDAIKWLEAHPPLETDSLEETIKNATKSNQDYAAAQKLIKDRALLAKMTEESEQATVNVESQREAIKTSIKEMTQDMVPGLEFDETGLVYNGLPVHPDTHSTSERIKLGMRMKIAQNKDIGVLFLENLESVDEDGLKAIMEEANALDMQVIGEEVHRGQKEMKFEIIGEEAAAE